MRKLGYVAILILCLAAGLVIGKVRQRRRAADSGMLISSNAGTPPVAAMDAGATGGAAGAMSSMTPDAMATMSPTTVAANDASASAAPTDTPPSLDAAAANRSFGATGASEPDPLEKKHPSHSSGGSSSSFSDSGSSMSAPPPPPSNDEVPQNQEIDGSSVGHEVVEAPPPPPPSSSRKTKSSKAAASDWSAPAATPAPAVASNDSGSGSIDDLPVIDDGSAGASSAPTPPPASMSAPPPPPPDNSKVAMIGPSAGDLTFPAGGDGPALRKISQRQNGDKSVVHIERTGGAKFRVFKIRNPNRVWVDFEETSVPGGDPQPVMGANHVKQISARYIKNSGGGIPIARVQILLNDDKIPNVDCEDAGAAVDCTIGGSAEKF